MSKRIMFTYYKTQLRSSGVKMIKEIILSNSVAVTSNTEDTKILAKICTCKKLLEKYIGSVLFKNPFLKIKHLNTLQMAEY